MAWLKRILFNGEMTIYYVLTLLMLLLFVALPYQENGRGEEFYVGLVAAGIFFLVGLAISFYHNVIKKKPRKEGAYEQAFK